MSAVTTSDFWKLGSVGILAPSSEVKLVGTSTTSLIICLSLTAIQISPSMGTERQTLCLKERYGYVDPVFHKGTSSQQEGADINCRYFKQPELTRESNTEDGWFKSGDIGQWEANGTLTIIDRVKNLVRPLLTI